MQGKCGNCRFWGRPEDRGVYRLCTAIEHYCDTQLALDEPPPEERHWIDEEEKRELIETIRAMKNRAFVEDGSGYHAALKCRSDFGCVLFEEKK